MIKDRYIHDETQGWGLRINMGQIQDEIRMSIKDDYGINDTR